MSVTTERGGKSRRPQANDDEDDARQPLYAAPALDKGLDILEFLSKQEEAMTRRDIAEGLGRSVSEIFRMIDCLARRSYIVQEEDSFSLGLKLFELAHEFPPMNRLLKEALPRMEALAKAADQSCHLTVMRDGRQIVIAQVDTPEGIGFSLKVGAKVDLLKSASGHVLLAFQEAQEAERLISQAAPDLDEATHKTVLRTIAKVRKQGFAFMKSRQFSGVEAISYPVFDRRGHTVAALTVPYVTRLDDRDRPPAQDAQAALAETVARLNSALGSKGPKASGPQPT